MGGLAKFRENSEKFENDLEVRRMTFRNIVTGEISKWMNKRNLKQTDMADRMGVSKPSVSALLSGDRNLTLDKIVELADAIGCRPHFRLTDKNDDYRSPYTFTEIHVEKNKKTTLSCEGFSISHEVYSSVKYTAVTAPAKETV